MDVARVDSSDILVSVRAFGPVRRRHTGRCSGRPVESAALRLAVGTYPGDYQRCGLILEAMPGRDAFELPVQFVFDEIANCRASAANEMVMTLAVVQFVHDARITQRCIGNEPAVDKRGQGPVGACKAEWLRAAGQHPVDLLDGEMRRGMLAKQLQYAESTDRRPYPHPGQFHVNGFHCLI